MSRSTPGSINENTAVESEWTQPLPRLSTHSDTSSSSKRSKSRRTKTSDLGGSYTGPSVVMEDTSSCRSERRSQGWNEQSPHTPLTMCSRTSSGTDATLEMTPASSGSDASLDQIQSTHSLEDDSKKKKKKKSKKKKDKKKSKSKKKSKGCEDDDDDEIPLTVQDEKLVEELCSFLTSTLSTSSNKESFLRMLKEDQSAPKNNTSVRSFDETSGAGSARLAANYSRLTSPDPSVCASLASHRSTLSEIYKRGNWTNVDPPSVVASVGLSPVPSQEMGGNHGDSSNHTRRSQTASIDSQINKRSHGSATMSGSEHSLGQESERSGSRQSSSANTTQSGTEYRASVTEDSSPEELFLALPPAFRTYLLGLHAEEMEQEQNQGGMNESLLLMGHHGGGRDDDEDIDVYIQPQQPTSPQEVPLRIPQITACDAQSVISELSGLTGVVSTFQKPTYRPPVEFVGNIQLPPIEYNGRESGDDDSDSSDSDSEEEFDDDENPANCLESVCSHYYAKPRRSSIIDAKEAKEIRDQIKKVRFDFVHVREYDTVLDCNPGCTEGPSIALGWFKVSDNSYYVSEYGSKHCRYNDDLILSRHTREGILLKMGYTPSEINAMVRRINKAKKARKRTAQTVMGQHLEYAMERVGRRFKFLVRGGSKRRVSN